MNKGIINLIVALCLALGSTAAASGDRQGIDLEELARAPTLDVWEADVGGLQLRYHLVDLRSLPVLGYAQADFREGTCNIFIDAWLNRGLPRVHKEVVLHEVGHCVDLFELGFDHNGFYREGCMYGDYYCDPAEGYAETWRYAYLATCGTDLHSIGYRQADGSPCDLPDPRSVTLQMAGTWHRVGRMRELEWFIGLR